MNLRLNAASFICCNARVGKRTAQAAIRIAVEMVEEGIIDKKTALLRVDPDQLNQLLHRRIDDSADR